MHAALASDGVHYGQRSVDEGLSAGELETVLEQWADDGFAQPQDDGWLVPWNAIYEIQDTKLYDDVLNLAQLPRTMDIVPELVSSGSLTDPHFSVAIAGWRDSSGVSVQVRVSGPVADLGDERGLLSPSVWQLVQRIEAFANRSEADRSSQAHRLAWGEIRALAIQCGASLDDFLYRTVVLAPDKLLLRMRKGDARLARLVEIVPDFASSPEGWLQAFDKSSRVKDRYDLRTPDGVVQVVVSPEVRSVLNEVKRMPGRRVSGARAEAFLANPFATLGDAASQVIDEDEFEQEKESAGLVFEHFTAFVESDAGGQPVALGLVVETATQNAGVIERYRFASDDEAKQFVSKVRDHVEKELQLCAWKGFDFELLGDSLDQVRILEGALSARERPAMGGIQPDAVFDLTLYSPRIEGIGEERPYLSPYIARKNKDEGWFPDNLVTLVGIPSPEPGGEPTLIPILPDELEKLQGVAKQAQAAGEDSITLLGASNPVPVDELVRALDELAKAKTLAGQGGLEPTQPKRRPRTTLILKPNIDSLDYLERRREALEGAPDEPDLPATLAEHVQLKAHQRRGVAWLQHLFEQSPDHCRGALLADDMGLGKTLQLLTLIAWVRERADERRPGLVVAPVALLENWAEEVTKFFAPGSLEVLQVYGEKLAELRIPPSQVADELKAQGLTRFLKPGWIGSADIVLTTYETLRDHEFSFAAEQWSVLVCDEAQKIKNPNAMVTRSAKKQQARFRVACTGTPVENSLADLWCLFDFVQPGLLGALNEFGQRYRRPIEAETDEQRERVEELRALISPQVLRRMKADVASDLPPKLDEQGCKALPLSTVQRNLYAQAVNQYGQREDPESATPFRNALGLLHYLRILSTDPQPYGLSGFQAEAPATYRQKAPKLDWLLHQLVDIRARGEKALIFCEFRDVQRLLRHYIEAELSYRADIVNGDTSASSSADGSRQKKIQAFQEQPGFGAIILSPLAVGFGLNIQAANHVIHYTRLWNPAKEDQATDRAHRIGQTRPVHVYTPIVAADDFKTFDVKLDELLTRKRGLAADMLNGTGDLSSDEFDIGGVAPPGTDAGASAPLTIADVDRMQPRPFEALIAVLWCRNGFSQADLTPSSNDRGVDVVAIATPRGELIQCKHSGSEDRRLNWEAIKDVVTGEAGYRAMYPGIEFEKVCVTNQRFNATAVEQAHLNGVRLVERDTLQVLLEREVTMDDVYSMMNAGRG